MFFCALTDIPAYVPDEATEESTNLLLRIRLFGEDIVTLSRCVPSKKLLNMDAPPTVPLRATSSYEPVALKAPTVHPVILSPPPLKTMAAFPEPWLFISQE